MYSLKSNSIQLSPSVLSFLQSLAERVPFDFVVTSGTRSSLQQVNAMFQKIELGDDLLKVYKDDTFAQSIIDAYPDTAAAVRIVEQYAAAGGGSSHLRGLGVDIRSRDLTAEQIQTIKTESERLGAFVLVERTPPHIHITVKKKTIDKRLTAIPILAALAIGVRIWTK